jgi:hypothetical protein
MISIFVSYRRDDSAGHAGRLFDRLVDRYGEQGVFMDHHDLAPGLDFASTIQAHLDTATVVLPIIGPRWADARDTNGGLRLFQPDDFVRRELAYALRANKMTIPVLVAGAGMPTSEQVPDVLQPLLRLQACELRDSKYNADVQALLDALPARATAPAKTSAPLAGVWRADVRYPWQNAAIVEQFDFELDGDELFGTGTYLGAARPIEQAELLEDGARFTLYSEAAMGGENRRMTHRYRVRVDGDLLHVRMQSSGGFSDGPPLKFVAHRVV